MRFIDKLSVSFEGVIAPKGPIREVKQTYIDFRPCVETIRANMSTDGYWSQSYTTDLTGALSLEERLSYPDAYENLVWVGSDATLEQRSTVDYTHQTGTVFSFPFCLEFLSDITGLPRSDFVLIAISELLSFVCFLRHQAKVYQGKLLSYAGGNTNVVTWLKHRKPRNRAAQFLIRCVNRLEVEHGFTIFPCYIASMRNVLCGEISRVLFVDPPKEFLEKYGLEFIPVADTFIWFLRERLKDLPLILPTDQPDRASCIMRFVEKRMVREAPKGLAASLYMTFLGAGTCWWASVRACLENRGITTRVCPGLPKRRRFAPTPRMRLRAVSFP